MRVILILLCPLSIDSTVSNAASRVVKDDARRELGFLCESASNRLAWASSPLRLFSHLPSHLWILKSLLITRWAQTHVGSRCALDRLSYRDFSGLGAYADYSGGRWPPDLGFMCSCFNSYKYSWLDEMLRIIASAYASGTSPTERAMRPLLWNPSSLIIRIIVKNNSNSRGQFLWTVYELDQIEEKLI